MGASASTRHLERAHQRAALADPPGEPCAAFELVVTGEPIGFARMRTGNGSTFIPDRQRTRMGDIRTEWIAAGRPRLPAGAYWRAKVIAFHARPAGHFLRDGSLSAEGRRPPYPGAPDIDNVAKLALDALVGCGAVPDDRLLVNLSAVKRWGSSDDPHVWVRSEVA